MISGVNLNRSPIKDAKNTLSLCFRTIGVARIDALSLCFRTIGVAGIDALCLCFRTIGVAGIDALSLCFRTKGVAGIDALSLCFRTIGVAGIDALSLCFRTIGVAGIDALSLCFRTIGVAGIDATLEETENFLSHHQWGTVYSFLINKQGETIFHPRLKPSTNVSKTRQDTVCVTAPGLLVQLTCT